MVVIIIDNASERMRGELTRWLLEAKPGVFIGNISAAVRERLWDRIQMNDERTGGLLIFNSDTEQKFQIKMCGDPKRSVVDIDGIQLIKIQ